MVPMKRYRATVRMVKPWVFISEEPSPRPPTKDDVLECLANDILDPDATESINLRMVDEFFVVTIETVDQDET